MTETTRLALALIAGLLSIYAFVRAIYAEAPSRTLAGWALCLGLGTLALYPTPDSLLGFDPITDPVAFPAAQVVRVVAGLATLALGIAALDRRRRGGGAVVAGPILALLLAVLHVGVGWYNFREGRQLARAFALEEPGLESKVVERGDLQLRLPSSRWSETPLVERWARTGFAHLFYPMHAFIVSESGGEESDFDAAAREAISGMERDADRAPPKQEQGTNPKGCRYFYATRTERNKGTPMFVATSVTWCPVPYVVGSPSGVLVHLIFEAKLTGRMPEDAVAKHAAFICKSVEPKSPATK